MTGYEDKINQLAQALDSVDVHVRAVDATAKREHRNRLNMLHLHAAAAIVVGALFMTMPASSMTATNWIVINMIPGTARSLGLLLLIGGLILGPATHTRNLRWEKIGLWLILLWYATIAFSFGTAAMLYLAGAIPGAAAPAFYAPMVYLHLTLVMVVHLLTLNRMTRLRRLRS